GFIRQILTLLAVVWLAATLAFLLLRLLPGDAIESSLAAVGANQAEIDSYRAQLGLDAPTITQYFLYLRDLLRGDFGISLTSTLPVWELIKPRLAPTIQLALSTLLLASLLGGLVGSCATLNGVAGQLARSLLNLALSVPVYWTGSLAVIIFSGMNATHQAIRPVLPVAVLSFHIMGPIGQVMQATIQQARGASFVLSAHAKG